MIGNTFIWSSVQSLKLILTSLLKEPPVFTLPFPPISLPLPFVSFLQSFRHPLEIYYLTLYYKYFFYFVHLSQWVVNAQRYLVIFSP